MVKKNDWSSRKGDGKWTGTKCPQQETSGKEWETQEALDCKRSSPDGDKCSSGEDGSSSSWNAQDLRPKETPGVAERELKKNPPQKKLESSKKKM